jgi:D-tyrosyl-tRNA(Tyr) deacylase
MIAVVQRVAHASVRAGDELLGSIGPGLLVLLGVLRGDGETEARRLAEKIAHFRLFEDEEGRMNRSALELSRAVLVVSQFTLAADGRKGRRPSFDRAAPPAEAEPLYESFAREVEAQGLVVARGRFGARMQVELANDGPVTFVLEEPPSASAESAS